MTRGVEVSDADVLQSFYDDYLERDGEVLVLNGTDLTLLSPLAGALMVLAHDGIAAADARSTLVRQFDPPVSVDVQAVFLDTIAQLVERGLLRAYPPTA